MGYTLVGWLSGISAKIVAVASRKLATVDRHICEAPVHGGGGGGAELCPVFAIGTLAFTLHVGKIREKPQSGYLKSA